MSTSETVPAPAAAPEPLAPQSAAPVEPTEAAPPAEVVADVTDAPAEPTTEAAPAPDTKAAELVKAEEDKKDKKHGRKPFADLLNKIRKPLERPAPPEKKVDSDTPAAEEVVAAPAPPTAPAADIPPVDAAAPAEAEAAVEPATTEEAPKEVTTPRKERANIFDKITAFVMKPKSPKGRKSEVHKDETEEPKPVDALPAEAAADPVEPPAATEAAEPPVAADTVAPAEVTEENKAEKKEKSPKDLAKLARRFSGRLFGVVEKKDKVTKKPEPTKEEVEETADETPALDVAPSEAAPQIPAEPSAVQPTTDSPPPASEAAPVIAAAA